MKNISKYTLILGLFILLCSCKDDYQPIESNEFPNQDYLLWDEIKQYFDPIYTSYIDNEFENTNINKREYFDNIAYFGYIVRDCALIYQLTGENRFKTMCLDIINYIQSNYVTDGILMPKYTNGFWYRETFARTLRLYYEAYEYTKESVILSIIEAQVDKWIISVPREIHRGFKVFPYGLDSDKNLLSYDINPNQNLVIAWLFSSLYFCRESKFYKNQEFKEIVFEETNAAISLTTSKGELPLNEVYMKCYDSNYGGYSATILYCIGQLWGNQEWIDTIKRWGKWLYSSFPINHPWNMEEDKPNWVKDRHYASNLAERIPSFYISNISKEYNWSWVNNIVELFPDYNRFLLLKWYGLKTIPQSYIKELYNDLYGYDEPTITEIDGTIRIIWRNIESIKIGDKTLLMQDDSLDISLSPGSNIIINESNTHRSFNYSIEEDVKKIVVIDYNHPMH